MSVKKSFKLYNFINITDRVIYARKAGDEFGAQVNDGEKISQEMASVSSNFFFYHQQCIYTGCPIAEGVILPFSQNLHK